MFGIDEFAFRFPSVIAAAVWCQAVAVFAAPRIGARNALFACGIAATSLGVFVIGRAATADALLNALLVLALFDAWRVVELISRHGDLGFSMGKPALRRAYLWIALGVLTKGPVAILIPVAAVFLFALAARFIPARFTMRDAVRMFFDPLGWAILVVVAAPWYVAQLAINGRAFVDGFILRHNVERFTGTMQGHSGSGFYYLLMVPLLLWPWLAWLVAAIGTLLRDLRGRAFDPLRTFLWLWCVFVVGFFSLSGTKLPHYALYGCTPLFVLCAMERERVTRLWLAGAARAHADRARRRAAGPVRARVERRLDPRPDVPRDGRARGRRAARRGTDRSHGPGSRSRSRCWRGLDAAATRAAISMRHDGRGASRRARSRRRSSRRSCCARSARRTSARCSRARSSARRCSRRDCPSRP